MLTIVLLPVFVCPFFFVHVCGKMMAKGRNEKKKKRQKQRDRETALASVGGVNSTPCCYRVMTHEPLQLNPPCTVHVYIPR